MSRPRFHPPGPRAYPPYPGGSGYVPPYGEGGYYPSAPYGGHPPPRYGGPPANDSNYYEQTPYSSSDELSSAGHYRGDRDKIRGDNVPDSSRRRAPPPPTGPGLDSGSSDTAVRSSADGGTKYANDCEIIVMAKGQQQYAEIVERQIRETGLTVDMMFPKIEIKITEFLKPIAKLGTIFAIIIENENERNKSIHFYQFRGVAKPTFFKNVPLHMGKDMLVKKYNELKQEEIGLIPENIKGLLRRFLEDQAFLKDLEYIELVKFIQERRNRQNSFLNRTNNVVAEHKSDIESLIETVEGKDLQKRIMNILNEDTPKPS